LSTRAPPAGALIASVKATLYATLSALKRFFVWLAGQPGRAEAWRISSG
jgi:hypothetical protein